MDNQTNNEINKTIDSEMLSSGAFQELKTIDKNTIVNGSVNQKGSLMNNKRKGALLVVVPIFIFAIASLIEPFQILIILLVPLFMFCIVYGSILFFVKDKPKFTNSDTGELITRPISYKLGVSMLLVSLALFLVSYLILLQIERTVGHGGSEGGIITFPLIASGIILFLLSIAKLIGAYVHNLRINR